MSIVVTAFASIESAVNAIKRGAVDYVPKPFTPDQIRLAANRVVEANRLRRRLAELQEELDESGEPAFFESRSPTFLGFSRRRRGRRRRMPSCSSEERAARARTFSRAGFGPTARGPMRPSSSSIAPPCPAIS